MITIKDIAERANVSRTTVSRVLNESGYVSEDARKRVMKVIEETGYVPSEHAKSLRTKKTKVVGVILPKISTETAARVVNGIDDVLAKEGYQILLANTNLRTKKELEYLKLLQSRQVDGIILMATNLSKEILMQIKELKVPFVALGQDIPDQSSVFYDDYRAAQEMTELFIKEGHDRIAFIGVDESDRAVGYLRKRGFLDTLEKHGISIEETYIETAEFSSEAGYEAMERILETSEERPTGVFAVTDRLAIGAMKCLKEKGIVLPQDMKLAGVGASELSKYVTPALTTIDFQYEEAGAEAAKLIMNKVIHNQKTVKKFKLNYGIIRKDSL
ncbi:DNA-binding protein [Bacillus coahuilensis m2-6]|uniref:DNA-binding protein n=1 Tax=Bacillus coahuilensis p1.1.43 TaxID=1150625 RepID=A0A147K471_9BACI|nr:LacI family DNA-binding transcriptional regulator [Bacillus coahuilensis]KUP04120.1 DNA-binding protein [Bacillus coahuilensis p1.1.43]KUP05104.1 DNA-binding protein [Bacillus coahuilensis m2-6]